MLSHTLSLIDSILIRDRVDNTIQDRIAVQTSFKAEFTQVGEPNYVKESPIYNRGVINKDVDSDTSVPGSSRLPDEDFHPAEGDLTKPQGYDAKGNLDKFFVSSAGEKVNLGTTYTQCTERCEKFFSPEVASVRQQRELEQETADVVSNQALEEDGGIDNNTRGGTSMHEKIEKRNRTARVMQGAGQNLEVEKQNCIDFCDRVYDGIEEEEPRVHRFGQSASTCVIL